MDEKLTWSHTWCEMDDDSWSAGFWLISTQGSGSNTSLGDHDTPRSHNPSDLGQLTN